MKLKALALAAIMSAGALPGVHADELPNGPHVVTSGKATVDARPDHRYAPCFEWSLWQKFGLRAAITASD